MTVDVKLPHSFEQRLQDLKRLYPQERSAILPALYLAQEHFGWINEDAVEWVSARLDIPPVHVLEVATFYTMYYKNPVGRYHIQVCRTLSCALKGSRNIVEYIRKRFGIGPGEISSDGMWSYEEVECLGSCGTAPACEINDTYFENLTEEELERIIRTIEQNTPDLRFSTRRNAMGQRTARE